MWNAKRILILVTGSLLFLGSYAVYSFFLGGIDALPPLPADYVHHDVDRRDSSNGPEQGSPADARLSQAFGAASEETVRPIRLWLREKGVALAAGQFDIEPDGRLKLSPFSAALFPKTKGEPFAEINMVQCEMALITLDRPVSNLTELASRKVTGVELRDQRGTGITIVNNRRTPRKDDDLELIVTNGSLRYEQHLDLIWTDGFVKMIDPLNNLHPTTITAQGMELRLSKDTGPNRPKTARPAAKNDGISGVEMLVLRSNVDMHLWVDATSGFLAPQDLRAETKAPAATADKSHVIIKSHGAFKYDLTKEQAWFDTPVGGHEDVPAAPEQVLVQRVHKAGVYDQLLCDHLELHFRKKNPEAPGPRDSRTGDKEIEAAVATARPGREVVLTMDSEMLEAYGNELTYRAATASSGPQTLLKGAPMHALKAGHKIEARELLLIGADKKGEGQTARAKGPGQSDLYSRDNAKRPYPHHILWDDWLVVTKEREGAEVYDVLTLTGKAAFRDDEQDQKLEAQKIQVWMQQVASKSSPAVETKGSSSAKQRLHRVQATGQVHAVTADMVIRKAERLTISFLPELSAGDRLPEVKAIPVKAARPSNQGLEVDLLPPVTPGGAPASAAKDNTAEPNPEKKKKAPPLELQASDIVIYVTTLGTRKQLKEMKAEGSVHVHQDGEKPGETRVDIDGKLLTLERDQQGDLLSVFGDLRNLAKFELGDMKLWGPKILINQRDNTAAVDGAGAMDMPSNTNFDGTKTSKSSLRMTVRWKRSMLFNGKDATFDGDTLASQEGASLRCQSMTVKLDRWVSFKEGQKGNQGAKVDTLNCSQKVYVLDEKRDARNQVTQTSVIEGSQLELDNQSGPTRVFGPGRFRHLALSANDLGTPPPAPGAARPADAELKLTRIDFGGYMYSNTKATTRNAKFVDQIEVHHFPAASIDALMDPDRPPKNGFYMRCNVLSVAAQQEAGKTTQRMVAERQVFFRTQEFFGNADIVKFDEAQDLIIFEAVGDNSVTLYKQAVQGAKPQEIRGKKILYNRRKGTFDLQKVSVITTSWLDSLDAPCWSLNVADCSNPDGGFLHAMTRDFATPWWMREGLHLPQPTLAFERVRVQSLAAPSPNRLQG